MGHIGLAASAAAIVALTVAAGVTVESKKESSKSSIPPGWILKAYAKKASTRTGVSVRPRDLYFATTDLNGDGHEDWVIYSAAECGSAGCSADVFAYIGGRYCYVGRTRYGDAPHVLQGQYPDVKCAKQDTLLGEPRNLKAK